MSFLLLSQDCVQAKAQVRLPHRSRRTHRVPLRVQQDYEVTILTLTHRETEATSQNQNQNQRSSQKISKTQMCLDPHTFLMTQILRKWQPGSAVFTHSPKDRNCEVCQRTKITRAPCRRRNGEAVPRAENFGDLITADHKVLSDGCESRDNHRYAVVVQNLAAQWIQSYPCKTTFSQETQRSLQKFLEPNRKPEIIYTDNSMEFGKACEDLSWHH